MAGEGCISGKGKVRHHGRSFNYSLQSRDDTTLFSLHRNLVHICRHIPLHCPAGSYLLPTSSICNSNVRSRQWWDSTLKKMTKMATLCLLVWQAAHHSVLMPATTRGTDFVLARMAGREKKEGASMTWRSGGKPVWVLEDGLSPFFFVGPASLTWTDSGNLPNWQMTIHFSPVRA